jgi:hypothetical protein
LDKFTDWHGNGFDDCYAVPHRYAFGFADKHADHDKHALKHGNGD